MWRNLLRNGPFLSISMPNYNHGIHLPRRLNELLWAMPENAELIVVDDGSTDNSIEILQDFARKDSRIKLIIHERNMGVNASLQDILCVASGEYITFQSSDDAIFPTFFSEMLSFAEKNPGYAIYTSDFGYCYGDIPSDLTEIQSKKLLSNTDKPLFFNNRRIIDAFRTTDLWIPGHASLIKREYIEKAGGFDPKLEPNDDWFLIHSIALLGGVAYLPKTLAVWSMAPGGYSSQERIKKKRVRQVQEAFFRKLRGKEGISLRVLFRKSGVLRKAIRERFFYLLLRPIYWDFLGASVLRFIGNKFRKLFLNVGGS